MTGSKGAAAGQRKGVRGSFGVSVATVQPDGFGFRVGLIHCTGASQGQ